MWCCSASPIRCSARLASKTTDVAWAAADQIFPPTWRKAKALLAEAGYPSGFETTAVIRSEFRRRQRNRFACLVQESLGQIGIKTTINKIPGANWRTELNKKEMPLYTKTCFFGLARLPRILLLLVLSRQQFRVQHHELQVRRRWTN